MASRKDAGEFFYEALDDEADKKIIEADKKMCECFKRVFSTSDGKIDDNSFKGTIET